MPLPTTFAGVSARAAGMFAQTGYATLSLSASGVTTSLTYGATSGFGSLSATGGSGNFTYSVYSGNVPLGITLNTSSGYLTGVVGAGPNYATSNGLYPVVFSVYDNVTGLSAQSSSINISSTFTASWSGKDGSTQAIRITIGGTYTSYSLPMNGYSPCAGPDGNMWFRTGSGIVKINSSYTVTLVNSSYTGGPFGMVTASDGNMWSPDGSFSYMYRITTSGTVTSYTPTSGYVGYTCLGPDGNVYAESYGGTLVHRFTTSGSYTGFTLPTGTTLDICASLGGLVYVGAQYTSFTTGYRGRITGTTIHSTVYSMTTSGTFTLIVDNTSNTCPKFATWYFIINGKLFLKNISILLHIFWHFENNDKFFKSYVPFTIISSFALSIFLFIFNPSVLSVNIVSCDANSPLHEKINVFGNSLVSMNFIFILSAIKLASLNILCNLSDGIIILNGNCVVGKCIPSSSNSNNFNL